MSGSAIEIAPAEGEALAAPAVPTFDNFSFLGTAKEALIGDIRYSYHRFGKSNGGKPPLVLIQGLGATQYGWPAAVLEELARSRVVVIFDNPLAGMSEDVKAGERSLELTIPFMAQSVVEFIASLNLGAAPDVLGVSMGGIIAQWIAAHHRGAVRSVVAAATSFGKGAPEPEGGISSVLDYLSSKKAMSDVTLLLPLGEQDPGYPELGRHMVSLQYACIPDFMGVPGAGYATAGGIIPPKPQALEVLLEVRAKQAGAIRAFWEGPALLPRLAASKTRVLWISGTNDRIFPLATAAKAAAAVPGSWMVEVEGAGHGVFCRQPAEFAHHVLKFLDATKEEDKLHRRMLEAQAPPGCLGGVFRSLWR